MSLSSLGQGGYLRGMKEAAYNTPLMTTPIYFLHQTGTLKYEATKLEKDPLIGSRIPQLPEGGDKKVGPNDLTLLVNADSFSKIMNWCHGASTNSGSNSYLHTWLLPITGTSQGGSFTLEQAIGYDLASQFAGCKITKWTLKAQAKGFVQLIITVVGVGLNDPAVARATTITVSSVNCYRFADSVLQLTPASVSQFTQLMNSWEVSVDLGYLEAGQRFQSGADTAVAPVFGTLPKVTFKCNIDSERRFEDWAVSRKAFKIDFTLTSTSYCYSTTPYSVALEIPVAQLKSSVARDAAKDHLTLDLDFEIYGGTTTGSGTDSVQMEIRSTDATATWPA